MSVKVCESNELELQPKAGQDECNSALESSLYAYDRVETHEMMLKDSVRMLAYRDAIYNNKELFQGKIVLDVGCGTGILSLFAAKAGAAKVIAVECSRMANAAKQIVLDNHYENVIVVIKGFIEQVEMPEGIDKVDIILAEWMGNGLYIDSMLSSVLYARDKWLRPGGLMLPTLANLYVAGVMDNQHVRELNFWRNVEGFDMSCIRHTVAHQAIVDYVSRQQLLTSESCVHSLNMNSAQNKPIYIKSLFALKTLREGNIHAIALYFDVRFVLGETQQAVGFSTAPNADWTHWQQTLLHLDAPLQVKKNELIYGEFTMLSNEKEPKTIDFQLSVSFKGELCEMEVCKRFNSSQQANFVAAS